MPPPKATSRTIQPARAWCRFDDLKLASRTMHDYAEQGVVDVEWGDQPVLVCPQQPQRRRVESVVRDQDMHEGLLGLDLLRVLPRERTHPAMCTEERTRNVRVGTLLITGQTGARNGTSRAGGGGWRVEQMSVRGSTQIIILWQA